MMGEEKDVTRRHPAQRGRSVWSGAAAAALCLLAATGCSRSKPATAPTPVALAVPPPPARVISTPPEPVTPTETTTVARPAPAARPARSSRAAPRPEPPRQTEPVRADAPADSTTGSAPAEPAPNSGPLLRTPQTADEVDAERRVRDVLGRAKGLLDRMNPARLGPQARQQHETARRFVEQSEQAMSDRNYVLAASLADKAETLAKGLSR